MSEHATKGKTREARTRGADPDAPLNRPGPDTPGFIVPARKRVRIGKLDPEARAEFLRDLYELGQLGATDLEIANFFDTDTQQVHRWRSDPEARAAMDSGKEIANERVAKALYHRAVGYSFRAEKIFQSDGQVIRVPYVEHIPPDIRAIEHWLYNRSDDWYGLKEIRIRGSVTAEEAVDPAKLALALIAALREGGLPQSPVIDVLPQTETPYEDDNG